MGIYPQGASPYGVHDMAGNVWEWCVDKFDEKAAGDTVRRVLRGGSWSSNQDLARASFSRGDDPDIRLSGFGCRVVCVEQTPE